MHSLLKVSKIFIVVSVIVLYSCTDTNPVNTEESSQTTNVQITLSNPDTAWTHSEVTITGTASSEIEHIRLKVDSEWIATVTVEQNEWSIIHQFKRKRSEAILSAEGLKDGDILATVTSPILVDSLPHLYNIPYYYQYSNSVNPAGSCQNTSLAIIFNYFVDQEGKRSEIGEKNPDYFSRKWGTSKAQSVSGFEDLFNREAALHELSVRDKGTTKARISDLRSTATSGVPSVVHGYFTNYGHILVVLGFDGDFYYCHDPAGKWSQRYKYGGYSTVNPEEGKYIAYRKSAFEQAVSPDGFVWIHVFE